MGKARIEPGVQMGGSCYSSRRQWWLDGGGSVEK